MLAEQMQPDQLETQFEYTERIKQRLQAVPRSKVVKASHKGRSDSICWGCANCSTSKCAWVAKLEPVWDKAVRVSSSGHAFGPYAYRVQDCQFFEEEIE